MFFYKFLNNSVLYVKTLRGKPVTNKKKSSIIIILKKYPIYLGNEINVTQLKCVGMLSLSDGQNTNIVGTWKL